MSENPLLSVVIPSFNAVEYVDDCIASIAQNRRDDVEFLWMDGGSKDGTFERVRARADLFATMISERDGGQSAAINKGFARARGTYLTWLNADDVLLPGGINALLGELRKTRSPWYAYNMVYIDPRSRIMKCLRSGGFERRLLRLGVLHPFGPSTVIHRSVYAEAGPFREDYHYAMDWEYWWRLACRGVVYRRINHYVVGLRLHATAKTSGSVLKGVRAPRHAAESEEIRATYFANRSTLVVWLAKYCFAKIWRCLNLSYPRAWLDTMRLRGKPYGECC